MKKNSGSEFNPLRIYRNPEQGILLGVCAGIADYLGVPVRPLRVVAGVLFVLLFIPTSIAYLAAGLWLPIKPVDLRLGAAAEAFRVALRESPERAIELMEGLVQRSRERVERLEAYVTSKEFGIYDRVAENLAGRSRQGETPPPPPPRNPLQES